MCLMADPYRGQKLLELDIQGCADGGAQWASLENERRII
jgi:hypothetical protein